MNCSSGVVVKGDTCKTPTGSFGDASLSARFDTICRTYPARIAVTCEAEQVTFAALHAMSEAIAGRLRARAVSRGDIVAILLDRSIAMVAAMLGVLKAGAAYLPLDPQYPAARLAETLQDARPAAILSTQQLRQMLPETSVPFVLLDAEREDEAANLTVTPATVAARDDIAYLMYTSGSTGKPKGVLVTHGNVLRLFAQAQPIYRFDHNDVWTMFHSFAFDFSVWELYGALLHGGRVVIVPIEVSRTPEAFYALLATENVTVLNQTPSAFRLLLGVQDSVTVGPLSLRTIIFGGEALAASMLAPWFARHGDVTPRVFNMYGITETTVHVTCHQVTPADTITAETPMGSPLGDLAVYLLDDEGQPTPPGQVGELYVSGAGVARGYHDRPVLTGERFLHDPFCDDGTVMYRSGDLARVREDGALVYAGRGDDQVKINGFRMELGEIEAAVAACPGVRQACVLVAGEAPKKALVAYFVADAGAELAVGTLAAFLAKRLPPHMMPSRLLAVATMPLTANGKVDRKALPAEAQADQVVESFNVEPGETLSELESAVLTLVRDTLRSQHILVGDNFFAAGIESLQSTRFAVRVREHFGVRLTLRDLFEAETIRDIAVRIEELILEDLATVTEEQAQALVAQPLP